ncbi:G1 family glutamic endopeptidase [Clostridium sp. WILCCON 0269]|uniref:G1 family glutamic endopeptidase n=1 Tax=Candidatus Clostridium eludens TaxID=3381663 RepID=A0ABW8SUG5_9CLOT
MKTILKKVPIILLVALVGFGGSTVHGASSQPITNDQYVLSGYFPNRNLRQSGQLQDTVATTQLPANTQQSSNWGGYIVTPTSDSSYTSVSGSWTIPSISATQQDAVAAQWIGLGGVSTTDLLQMGTIEEIQNGQPTAEVFWEQLPDVAQNVLSVPIGSTINVSIAESSSSTWNLTFTANTPDGQTQTQTISTTLDSSYDQEIGTSAEWISEDPSNTDGQLFPLANMGTVKYQSAMVNGQALNASGNTVQPIAMVSSSGAIVISPSELGADGESFTTTNTNSTSTRRSRRRLPRQILRHSRSFEIQISIN